MYSITNSVLLLIRTAILVAGLALVIGAKQQADNPTYLEVSSHGYSRFEISKEDVVVFYTEGVEFDYLNLHAEAESLRYNHATHEAVITGVISGHFDQTEFNCEDVYLNGADGVMEINGGVRLDHEEMGITLECGNLKANYPSGFSELTLGEMIISASDGVRVITDEGHVITTQGLVFTGYDMVASTVGGAELVVAERMKLTNGESLPLSGMQLDTDGIVCRFDENNQPQIVEIKHVTGVSEQLNFSAKTVVSELVTAEGLTSGSWDVVVGNLCGEAYLDAGWLQCSAGHASGSLVDSTISSILMSNNVIVDSNRGSFRTDTAKAIFIDGGYKLFMPDDVVINFNLSSMSGQDSVSFNAMGTQQDD